MISEGTCRSSGDALIGDGERALTTSDTAPDSHLMRVWHVYHSNLTFYRFTVLDKCNYCQCQVMAMLAGRSPVSGL